MSRTKTTDIAEANPIEESSAEKEAALVSASEQTELLPKSKKNSTEDTGVVQKINLTRYLEINPQSAPIEGLMRNIYGLKFNSKSDWDLLLQKLVGEKIN